MAISIVAVGQKITAAIANAIIALVNAQGQTGVIPTSVAGGGVSVAANGRVSFSASTAVNINGCFTSTYTHYRIEIFAPTTSASLNYNIQLRASGTDATAANYDWQELKGSSATGSAAQSLAGTSWAVAAATSAIHKTSVELSNPAVAAPTIGIVTAFSVTNPMTAAATTAILNRGLLHRLSTAYDGMTINFSGGNATGTVRIYGWNENV